jgi:hypothetical protein
MNGLKTRGRENPGDFPKQMPAIAKPQGQPGLDKPGDGMFTRQFRVDICGYGNVPSGHRVFVRVHTVTGFRLFLLGLSPRFCAVVTDFGCRALYLHSCSDLLSSGLKRS